jgi:putative nucleotidyltransferase with HDIG domain
VFSADDFWAHSLSTAAAAKILATAQGVPFSEREDFFVAGLMHDLGKIPLNHLFPDAYREAAQLARRSGQGMRSAEDALIGVDHCSVGLMIARKWQLSDALTGALGRHHVACEGESNGLELADVVALADALAHDMGATIPGGLSLNQQGREELKARWKLSPGALTDLTAAVADEVEKAKVFLDIAARR